jgi:apoptosis-inducing factor 3
LRGQRLGSRVARIEDKQVLLQGGEQIDADIVVVGIGVEPRLGSARRLGWLWIAASWSIRACRPAIPTFSPQATLPAGPIPILAKEFVWNIGSSLSARARSRPQTLGRDEPFTMVSFFWTKHLDLSIRYVGHAEKWDETLVDGNLAQRDGLVRFRRADRDLAVATVERDKESLRTESAMEGEFRP